MWEVDIKGTPGKSFEISVLLAENKHGKRSYGWFGPDKLLISGSGGPCCDVVTDLVWGKLVAVAKEVAADLNRSTEAPHGGING